MKKIAGVKERNLYVRKREGNLYRMNNPATIEEALKAIEEYRGYGLRGDERIIFDNPKSKQTDWAFKIRISLRNYSGD